MHLLLNLPYLQIKCIPHTRIMCTQKCTHAQCTSQNMLSVHPKTCSVYIPKTFFYRQSTNDNQLQDDTNQEKFGSSSYLKYCNFPFLSVKPFSPFKGVDSLLVSSGVCTSFQPLQGCRQPFSSFRGVDNI